MKRDLILISLAAAIMGISLGIGAYTFVYAKGYSYLINDPAVCANCHVMQGHYDAWMKGSHRAVAACNSCHLSPHPLLKYKDKASNGFWHSFAFTTGDFPEPLHIKPHNRAITEEACRSCHADIVEMMDGWHQGDDRDACTRCHYNVGHLR